MRRLIYVILIFNLVSCKHEMLTEIKTPFSIHASSLILYTSDSISLQTSSNEPITWNIEPEIGSITVSNYYHAPSTVLKDSQEIIITAYTKNEKATQALVILKRDEHDTTISFSKTILPLMVNNCNFNGCHGNGSKAGKVDLSSYSTTINHVQPHQPLKSSLYLSLVKQEPLRRMPPAGALHQYRIDYFKKWIEQGAIDN